MASTGMALSGKYSVSWNGTDLERTGSSSLPSTLENEVIELVSNKATRKEIVAKGGFDDTSITCFFNPANYLAMREAKTSGTIGSLVFTCSASDGGAYSETFLAQVTNVAGAEGDVEGVMESFEVTFGIKTLVTASGVMGTTVYTE